MWKAGIAACAGILAATAQPPSAALAGTAGGTVQYMQIVAHPDDDVFFFNPEIYQQIQHHFPTVTIYSTASEISGNGNTPAEKAKSLQRGVMDAYARMAGVPDINGADQEEWAGESWAVGGKRLERYHLKARPEVQLVFIGLHDAKLGDVYDHGLTDSTVVPTNPKVNVSYQYNKAAVTSMLGAILNAYHPSVLAYQDTVPDSRFHPDHADHFATARFVDDALVGYSSPVVTVQHRDYNIENVPENLSPAAVAKKTEWYRAYKPYDDFADPSSWLLAQYFRWPIGTKWVAQNKDGHPQAFVTRNGRVYTMFEKAGGTWSTAAALAKTTSTMLPTLQAVKNTNGTLQVFGRRTDHHIVTLRQNADQSWPTSWTDLGNPNLQFGGEADQVGTPTVVAQADGALWVFVKDGGGGLCAKKQNSNGGGWGDWVDEGGSWDTLDGLAAILGSDNKIAVFANGLDVTRTWRQTSVNGPMAADDDLPTAGGRDIAASPPAVTVNHDGTLEVIYHNVATARLITTWENGVGGSWTANPSDFGGNGIGQPALITAPPGADARIMVFTRNDSLGVSMTMQSAPDSPYGAWTDLGGTLVDTPAPVLNAAGQVYVFGIGSDGAVYVRKQSATGATAPFNDWALVG